MLTVLSRLFSCVSRVSGYRRHVIAFINRSTRMDYAVSFYDGRVEFWSIVQPASRFERSKISESIVSSISGFADVKCIPGGAYSYSGEQCLNSAWAIDLGDAQSCVTDAQSCVSSVAVVVVLYFLYISIDRSTVDCSN